MNAERINMKSIDSKRFHEIIEELVCDNCTSEYCFLKKFIESLHPSPIVLIQFKCIERFKWEESERENKALDWNEAAFMWSDNGYATAFRKVFDEDLTVREIYSRTMNEMKKYSS